MAKVCIICYQEKNGAAVLDDAVITTIRRIKRKLNMAKNNTLVVCVGCMETYWKKRQKYERDLVMHVVLAGIVLIVFVLAPIFTSGFSIPAILLGVLLAALIVALSVFSHCPKVAGGKEEKKETSKTDKRKK